MKPIKEILQLHLCFDEIGREIEVLDVSLIDKETLIIEENPIFNEQVSYGDIIRVKQEKEIFYYIETIQKSDLIRHSWLLSKDISESEEIEELKERINKSEGRCEQVFGGLLVVNIPKDSKINVDEEINKIIKKTDN